MKSNRIASIIIESNRIVRSVNRSGPSCYTDGTVDDQLVGAALCSEGGHGCQPEDTRYKIKTVAL